MQVDPIVILYLLPVILISIALLVYSFLDLIRPERKTRGPKWVWLLILMINIIGPIAYLLMGRED